jgi:hypothetical protein
MDLVASPADSPADSRLAYRGILKLRGRAGDRVDCLDGRVWITQDGDLRDVVLDAGQVFTLDRAGTAIVYALTEAAVALRRRVSFTASRRFRMVLGDMAV